MTALNPVWRLSRWEMDCQGFLRLLRDCHILDNKLTIVQAESVFCGPRAPRGDGPGFASASPRQVSHSDAADLRKLLTVVGACTTVLKAAAVETRLCSPRPHPVAAFSALARRQPWQALSSFLCNQGAQSIALGTSKYGPFHPPAACCIPTTATHSPRCHRRCMLTLTASLGS